MNLCVPMVGQPAQEHRREYIVYQSEALFNSTEISNPNSSKGHLISYTEGKAVL